MKSYSAVPRSTSNCSLKLALKRLKNSRRLIDFVNEIDAILKEIQTLANKAERQTKKKS